MSDRPTNVRSPFRPASALEVICLGLRRFNSGPLLSLFSWILARPFPLTNGPILVIAPHQDDETFGCGGLIALKKRLNAGVKIAFLTDGANSPLPAGGHVVREALPKMRVREAEEAAKALGVPISDLHFLGLPDSRLSNLPEASQVEVVGQLSRLIESHKPEAVFVTHWNDGHGDHEAAFRFAVQAIRRTGERIELLQYSIWKPWLHPLYRLDEIRDLRNAYRLPLDTVEATKSAAIQKYPSQLETLPKGFLGRFRRPYELFYPVGESTVDIR